MTKMITSTIFLILAGCSSQTTDNQVSDPAVQTQGTVETTSTTTETTTSSVDVTVTPTTTDASVTTQCSDGSAPVNGVCQNASVQQVPNGTSH